MAGVAMRELPRPPGRWARSQPVELLPEPAVVPRLVEAGLPDASLQVGEAVRTPRHGDGGVADVQGDQIAVRFPDNSTRTFLAAFLRKPRARRSAPRGREPLDARA